MECDPVGVGLWGWTTGTGAMPRPDGLDPVGVGLWGGITGTGAVPRSNEFDPVGVDTASQRDATRQPGVKPLDRPNPPPPASQRDATPSAINFHLYAHSTIEKSIQTNSRCRGESLEVSGDIDQKPETFFPRQGVSDSDCFRAHSSKSSARPIGSNLGCWSGEISSLNSGSPS